MEQERKIEKWLRSYAMKRRGQAGDSIKLDPARRRILQNEVSRSAPVSEDDEETMSLWELLRKHWLYLLGFAACVFVLAALLLPIMNAPKSRSLGSYSTLSMTDRTRKMNQHHASAQAVAPEPALAPSETVASAGTPAAPREVNGPAVAPDMAPPTPPAPVPETLSAARESEKAASPTTIVPTTGIPATDVGGSSAMNSMAANSLRGAPTRGAAGGSLQRPASQKDYLDTVASPSQSAAVLVNFQVSQNGNTIRVVDQDGSVYTGALESGAHQDDSFWAKSSWAATAAQNANAPKTKSPRVSQFDGFGGNANKGNDASAAPAGIPSGIPTASASAHPGVQEYFFYAQGTNQTLKQSVVFAGTLLEDLSLASETQQTFGMSANAAIGAAYAQQFVRSVLTNQPIRIEGIAIIDQTNKIQINATSVPAKTSRPSK